MLKPPSPPLNRFMPGWAGGCLLAMVLLTGSALAGPPSAQKVLDRCRQTMDGKSLKRFQSLQLCGVVRSENEPAGSFTVWFVRPDHYRLDLHIGDREYGECYNGKSAWRKEGSEISSLIAGAADELQLLALLGNYRWTELKQTPMALGPQAAVRKSGKEGLWSATVRLRESAAQAEVNQRSWRLEGWEILDQSGAATRGVSDHRRVNGIDVPHRLEVRLGPRIFRLEAASATVDGALPADLFDYPRANGAEAAPDLPALLTALQQNQAEVERRREQFTCRKTEQTFERGKDGREKVKETKVFDVTPVGSQFVDRLISVDGKPLSTKEQAKEDKRVEKEIRELLQKKKKDGEIRISASDFLRISKVSSPRQERYRGHDVFVFDFEPRPGYKPRNREEEIVSRLAGHMWVDAEEKQIVRLAAHFTEKYSIGLGLLASISPSTAIVIQQEKINDEVWMPAHLELNLSGRALFFKLNLRQVLRYSDYQRVGVSVDYHIPPAS